MATLVAYALTTKEKVKEMLGISVTSSDDQIDSLINSVTDWVERYCGRKFLRTAHSNKIMDSKGYDKLFLPNYPIISVQALEYRSGSWGSPTWSAFTTNDYLIYDVDGYLQFASKMPRMPQGIRISYTAGYLIDFGNELDTTKHTLPFDLTQVVTEMVSMQYKKRNAHGVVRESVEGQSVEWSNEVSGDQLRVLQAFKSQYGF